MSWEDKRKTKSIGNEFGFILRCSYNPTTNYIFVYSQIKKLKSKEQAQKNNKDQTKKAKIVMTELKSNGCAICGYNGSQWSLVFHHSNPEDKKRRIDYPTLRCSDNIVSKELNKCILLCANCHGEIHELERASTP